MKINTFKGVIGFFGICTLIACIIVLSDFFAEKELPPPLSDNPLVADSQGVTQDAITKLQNLTSKIKSGEMADLSEAIKLLQSITDNSKSQTKILIDELSKANKNLTDDYKATTDILRKSSSEVDNLVAEMRDKMKVLINSNTKLTSVQDDVEKMNRQLAENNVKVDVEKVLKEGLNALKSGGGNVIRTSTRWVLNIPVVPLNTDGSPTDGLHCYELTDGSIGWTRLDRDPLDWKSIADVRERFSEKEVFGPNEKSPYTHLFVVADVVISVDIDVASIVYVHNEDNSNLVTVTFPKPRIYTVNFVWNPNVGRGMGCVRRTPPYNIDPLCTDEKWQYEKRILPIFLEDFAMNKVANPERFMREIANFFKPIFEKHGYAVDFAYGDCTMESLVEDYLNR